MRHSTGRRIGATFGWVALGIAAVLGLAAGGLTAAAVVFISETNS
ncbi:MULTISPECIES: hypothetical protein [unclassified Demequina]|nr:MULTISPECIES: hypothetical protein [unclassified Demequina]